MYDEVNGTVHVKGEVTLWHIDEETGIWTPAATTKNTIMLTWGSVAAHMFRGDSAWVPAGMYIEYKNVVSPGDAVTVPSFVRTDNLGYYNGLPASQDFIRATLSAVPTLAIHAGHEAYFAAGDGNKLTFLAQTSGTAGVLGRTFSDTVNSKVFGIALVAYPVLADRTKDILFARTYFNSGSQQLKAANAQIGATWNISFI